MHDLSVITLLAGALAVALVMGWCTQRLGLSTLVGYILAGIAVGPHTPGQSPIRGSPRRWRRSA
jgi:CPA2 family monovalent cation:H+ antiporter-2